MNKAVEKKEYVSLPYFGLNKLLPYLKPYRFIMISMVILGLLTSTVDIILPLFQQYALNHFIALGTLEGLPVFIILYVTVLLCQVVFTFVSCYQASQVEMYVGRDMKRASFNHLQTLSFSYYNQNSVGYIHARVMSDTNRIGCELLNLALDLLDLMYSSTRFFIISFVWTPHARESGH